MKNKHKPLLPRNGHKLVIGIVARISGGPNQKELSLQDQEDQAKQVVAELYDGSVEFRVIATKGKGERLERPELAQVATMLRSRELDLLVAKDIGRIVRGAEGS
ncbi:MAG: recombinase family protein [Gemmataceae bacterium]